MAQREEKQISKRVHFVRSPESLVITINQKVERWKESLLMAWLAAWLFCGIYFLAELIATTDSGLKTFLAISLAFWAFFLFRIGKVFFWRILGEEIIEITKETISIRNAMGPFGKKEVFRMNQIRKFGVIKYNSRSFFQFMDESFWIIGGDKFGFEYGGKRIQFGKQLNPKEVTALGRMLEKLFR